MTHPTTMLARHTVSNNTAFIINCVNQLKVQSIANLIEYRTTGDSRLLNRAISQTALALNLLTRG